MGKTKLAVLAPTPAAGTGLKPSLVGTTKRKDGKLQVAAGKKITVKP